MKKLLLLGLLGSIALTGCNSDSQDRRDRIDADAQMSQYAISQPVPKFNSSLERHLAIELLKVRNVKAATHTVWRSDYGLIEGDCPSVGFGMPYDTSLTNPLKVYSSGSYGSPVVEQAEPNGVFISKNTSATWVLCTGDNGELMPVYIESKVTAYPYPVDVNYETNRVTKSGTSSISF